MKILVLDDNRVHREAAKVTLQSHNVTIVGTYDEAQAALMPSIDVEVRRSLYSLAKEEAGLPSNCRVPAHFGDVSDEARRFNVAYKKLREQNSTYPDYDAVLTDLLVPPSEQAQGDEGMRFIGQEMPLGTTIALLALTVGIKNVAIATDKNHHDHPASAAFDCFGHIATHCVGIRLLCTNHVATIPFDKETWKVVDWDFMQSDAGKMKYPYINDEGWGSREGLAEGKNWGVILEQLLHAPMLC